MRILTLVAATLAIASPSRAWGENCLGNSGAGGSRLVVEAVGLRNGAGEVAFTVYPNDRRRFLARGGKLLRARVPAHAPITRACFVLPPGSYAIAQYHDENGDRNFNRTLIAPTEGFGFSNDAPTSIGLPKFEAARFLLPSGGKLVRMRMRYRR